MGLLTAIKIKNAKITKGKKTIKLSDGEGLYLLLTRRLKKVEGEPQLYGRSWVYKFRFQGLEQKLTIGRFPLISLAEARVERDKAKVLQAQGINPCHEKNKKKNETKALIEAKQKKVDIDSRTFEAVAIMWMATRSGEIATSTATKNKRRLEMYVFPVIGSTPISRLKKSNLAQNIIDIAATGSVETAHRTGTLCANILSYACDRGFIDSVPMLNLKTLLPAFTSKHMPAIIDPQRIGELLQAISNYSKNFNHASYVTICALKLLPYVFLRAGEFRGARWEEMDFEAACWTIPAHARKLRKKDKQNKGMVHIVPLSNQAVAILKELKLYTGGGVHVFPSVRGDSRAMCENTINNALASMGFKGEMVGHGWRSSFSTIMKGKGFNSDLVERQLSHMVGSSTSRAYDRGIYLKERKEIMQTWADYLDALRTGASW